VPGLKTNEREGTRAVLRHGRMSVTKARQVLDLIRGQDVDRASEDLRHVDREAAKVIAKVLASAVANARHNDGLDPEELFVSACYADEGNTLKRWRPRARGRATPIRKRTCHITIIVSRLPEDRLEHRRAQRGAAGSQRAQRVARSRQRADQTGRNVRRQVAREAAEAEVEAEDHDHDHDHEHDEVEASEETTDVAGDTAESSVAEGAEVEDSATSETSADSTYEAGTPEVEDTIASEDDELAEDEVADEEGE